MYRRFGSLASEKATGTLSGGEGWRKGFSLTHAALEGLPLSS